MPAPRRYQERSELRARLAYLFQSGEGTDLQILVERNDEDTLDASPSVFNAHRAVLLASSAPLRMMLLQAASSYSSSDADSNQPLPTIRLRDITPEAFASCLAYIYTGAIGPLTPSNCVDVFIAADRLDLPLLRKKAENYLPRAVNLGNLAVHLRKAAKAKQMQLVAYCAAYVGRHFDAFLETVGFLALPQSILVALLSSPNIGVENEDKVSSLQ
jgi:BTB/POZ domain/BTB And C-terminal Kelch